MTGKEIPAGALVTTREIYDLALKTNGTVERLEVGQEVLAEGQKVLAEGQKALATRDEDQCERIRTLERQHWIGIGAAAAIAAGATQGVSALLKIWS